MSTRELLLGTALALCVLLPQPSQAEIIANLGPGGGDFTRSGVYSPVEVGSQAGSFVDQYTFSVSIGPEAIATAIATNTFDVPAQEISNFTGAIYNTIDGIVGNGNDQLVLGIQTATRCASDQCQVLFGSETIGPGNYYLEITGKGSANAEYKYSGNLSIAITPGPIAGAGLPGLVMALAGILGWRRLRKVA